MTVETTLIRRASVVASSCVVLIVAVLAIGTSRPAAGQVCVGDCDASVSVTVDEIVTMVNIALGQAGVGACPAGDPSGDGAVTVDEILQAVNNALNGCPSNGGECTTASVTISLDFDPLSITDLAGVTVDLGYPIDAVSVPGSVNDQSVVDRVTDITGAGGFFDVADLDTDTDGTDDLLRTSVVIVGATLAPEGLAVVDFDCEAGALAPGAGDFNCTVASAADSFGNPLEEVDCSAIVATE